MAAARVSSPSPSMRPGGGGVDFHYRRKDCLLRANFTMLVSRLLPILAIGTYDDVMSMKVALFYSSITHKDSIGRV